MSLFDVKIIVIEGIELWTFDHIFVRLITRPLPDFSKDMSIKTFKEGISLRKAVLIDQKLMQVSNVAL